jgi:Mg2+/citrate symporter
VSFFKRLALFVLILTAMILFFGLFPVVAQSAPSHGKRQVKLSFNLIHMQTATGSDCFLGSNS